MVGFGSSLRMARRPGWEGAYLEYETLKLLLSQIEAVYEEESHRQRRPSLGAASASQAHEGPGTDVVMITAAGDKHPPSTRAHDTSSMDWRSGGGGDDDDLVDAGTSGASAHLRRHSHYHHSDYHHRNGGRQQPGQLQRGDFRHDIFSEMDSDQAYASVDDSTLLWLPHGDHENEWNSSSPGGADDPETAHWRHHQHRSGLPLPHVALPPVTSHTNQPFSLSYSQEAENSSESDGPVDVGCTAAVTASLTSWTTSASTQSKNKSSTSSASKSHTIPSSSSQKGRSAHHKKTSSSTSSGNGNHLLMSEAKRKRRQLVPPSRHMDEDEDDAFFVHPHRHHHHHHSSADRAFPTEDAFYVDTAGTTDPTTDAGQGNDILLHQQEQQDGGQYFHLYQHQAPYHGQSSSGTGSFLNAPVRRTSHERSGLLVEAPPPPTPGPSLLYTFGGGAGTLTPPKYGYPNSAASADSTAPPYLQASPPLALPSLQPSSQMGTVSALGNHQGPFMDTTHFSRKESQRQQRRLEQERQKERRIRRKMRRQLRQRRLERERKVPRYLRIAHAKARAITERFLGLLRAETEKVMLFAQSRLGELAETAGSLRFPSYNDDYYSYPATEQRGHTFEYPLSDGGMHPSASSSSDDGAVGLFPWSDGSDGGGDDASHGSRQSLGLPNSFSGGAFSDDTMGRSNRTRKKGTPIGGAGRKTAATPKARGDARKVPPKPEPDHIKTVRRQIAHYTELRKNRPMFQRNDQILGEDMLFLSAVEEADAYTAVGVELMHVLRYICVNLIAVRKICRKHDRLLMNRMLGGYYHRTKKPPGGDSAMLETQTLGGLLAKISGDIYEAHPALIGQMNHYKLVGVYDRKIQKLANSRTVQVVSSCLALALSEYEVSRSRADALTKLNETPKRHSKAAQPSADASEDARLLQPVLGSDDEEGPPTTASTVSLTRLRFAVTSIFALREAARFKLDYFATYLSRSMLSFTGQPIIGDGLDGCSRETLDFLFEYDPDSTLLLDAPILYEGLRSGSWKHLPISDVMLTTLAVATTQRRNAVDGNSSDLAMLVANVDEAISVAAESKKLLLKRLIKGQLPKRKVGPPRLATTELSSVALELNRITLFLYTMNYYISHSSTPIFVTATGSNVIYAALVIGIPNLAAMIAAIFHCWLSSRAAYLSKRRQWTLVMRWMFVISAMFAIVGNAVHAVAVDKGSLRLAVLGRFVYGLSSVEIVHRQIMARCRPAFVVAESSNLVRFRVGGAVAGLLVGALAEAIPITINRLGVRSLQSSFWLMMVLWIIQLGRLAFNFRPPSAAEDSPDPAKEEGLESQMPEGATEDSASDSSQDDGDGFNVLSRSAAELKKAAFPAAYGSLSNSEPSLDRISEMQKSTSDSTPKRSIGSADITSKRSTYRQVLIFAGRIRRLLSYHIGLRLSLWILMLASFSIEAFFTATPIFTSMYFRWSGAHAATFLGLLACAILPVNLIAEFNARRYEERTIIRRSLAIIVVGLIVMINWTALLSVGSHLPHLFAESSGRPNHDYDWKLGMIQFVLGLSVAFCGLIALEGSSLVLLSKVSPPRVRSTVVHVGTMSTFLSLTARLLADGQIVLMGLSHRVILTDLINALVIPLILCCLLAAYLVRKHFFFLM